MAGTYQLTVLPSLSNRVCTHLASVPQPKHKEIHSYLIHLEKSKVLSVEIILIAYIIQNIKTTKKI